MGFSETTGTALVLSHDFTIEELFDRISDVPFEAGHPRLWKIGAASVIAWPRLDSRNQVQIIKRHGKLRCVCSFRPVSLCAPSGEPRVSSFLNSILGHFGKTRDRCIALAAKTGKQINALRM